MSKVQMPSSRVVARSAGVRAGALPAVDVLRRGLAVGATLVAVLGAGAVTLPVGNAVATEGREFELVSPPDKKGNDLDLRVTVQASPDGDAVSFASPGAFADAATSIYGGRYVARRGADGWATHSIDPPQRNAIGQIQEPVLALSADLTKAFAFSDLALTPDASASGNLYMQDNLTGARTFVGGSTNPLLKDRLVPFANTLSLHGSSDLSHVVFQSPVPLLPEATPDVENVYEAVDGHLRLVNVLPDGTPDPAGGVAGSRARPRAGVVSADGSRVFFIAGTDGALYVRVNGTTTLPISVSRRAGDPPTPTPARFGGASKDGNIVYFASTIPLTDDTPGVGGAGGSLYRYDLTTDTLSNVSVAQPDERPGGVNLTVALAVSDDGESVYYVGDNTDEVTRALFMAHDGVGRRIYTVPGNETEGPQSYSLSPSGRYLAFVSYEKLAASDNTDPGCEGLGDYANPPGVCVELYLYDRQTATFECPACNPIDGQRRHAMLGPVGAALDATKGGYRPTVALDDGRVFFQTAARLVSEDTNGVIDVYTWDGERNHLISSGRGAADAQLADVANDGRDVYFLTKQQLVGADVDNAVDLYDARVGGGLASQRAPSAPVAPCDGDGCQGKLSVPGGALPLATVDFAGPGDPVPAPKRASGAIRVSGPKSGKGSRFVVTVKVPSAGKITTSGARARAASRRVSKAGSYRVGVVLSARAKRQLRKARRLKVAVRVTFTPSSGVSSSSTLSVTLKA